jgi:hypothetical protein
MITWRKSSHSDETGGACIELAPLPDGVAIRDSKAPDAGHLVLSDRLFADLLGRVKRNEIQP